MRGACSRPWTSPRPSSPTVAASADAATSAVPVPHRLPRVAVDVLALDRLALVVGLLAAGQADLDLDPALLEVGPQGNDGVAPLGGLAPELQDLLLVKEKLPLAPFRVVLD